MGVAQKQGNIPKQREFLWRTAEAQDRLGDVKEAEESLRNLIAMPLESEAQLVEALCFLADLQVASSKFQGLIQICLHTLPVCDKW